MPPRAEPTSSAVGPQLSADTRLKRPLIPLALALVIGIALGELADTLPLTSLALLGSLMIASWLTRRLLHPLLALPARQWIVVLAAAGYVVAHPPLPVDPALVDQDPATIEAVLDAPVRHRPDWASATADHLRLIASDGDRPVAGRIRLSGPPEVFDGLRYGDRVRLTADIRPPRGFRNPGLFDYEQFLARQDIVAVATVKPGALSRIGHHASPLDPIYDWRERIRLAALTSLPPASAPVFLAMVTGETGYLTAELRDRFMASGTVHLLSISGSHLGLIALVVFAFVRWTVLRLPERLLLRLTLRVTPSQVAAAVTLVPVTVYALLAGGQVATLRALLMITLYLVAVLIHREDDLLNALALAAVLILLWDPRALMDASFQLSFLSVLCIALGMEWWSHRPVSPPEDAPLTRWSRLKTKAALLLVTSIAAGVGTAPLVAHHFNQVNWVGLVSNPIIIPLAGVLVVPLGLASAVGAAAREMTTLPLAWLNTAALDLLLRAVEGFAEWPWSIIHVAAPSLATIAVGYLLLVVLLDRRSSPWKRGLTGGVLVIMLVPWLGGAPRWSTKTSLEVTFLDVGQGDGAIARFPSGEVMVIDGGTRFHELDVGRLVVAPLLWNHNQRRVDYLVASHPQLDHIGGLVYLAERFDIGQAWTNGHRPALWVSRRLEALIAARGIPETRIVAGERPVWIGAARVWPLNPPPPIPTAQVASLGLENDRSIVLQIEYGRVSFLLTGDLETAGERLLVSDPIVAHQLRSTVMKVPHHGSRGALHPAFLRAVAPRVAVVSVGATNAYGHPTTEMLAAYGRLGAEVLRTDRDGAIQLVTDGSHLQVYRYDDLTRRPVPWNRHTWDAEWRNLRTVLGAPVPFMSLDLSQTEPPI